MLWERHLQEFCWSSFSLLGLCCRVRKRLTCFWDNKLTIQRTHETGRGKCPRTGRVRQRKRAKATCERWKTDNWTVGYAIQMATPTHRSISNALHQCENHRYSVELLDIFHVSLHSVHSFAMCDDQKYSNIFLKLVISDVIRDFERIFWHSYDSLQSQTYKCNDVIEFTVWWLNLLAYFHSFLVIFFILCLFPLRFFFSDCSICHVPIELIRL